MTKKAQTIFTVCFVAFLISVVSLSFVFADSIPHNTETPQITGGYLFSFDVRCVDEDGNLLKNVSFLENGTAWAVDVPEIDGFTPGCTSISLVKRDENGQVVNNVVHTLSRPAENERFDISQEDLVMAIYHCVLNCLYRHRACFGDHSRARRRRYETLFRQAADHAGYGKGSAGKEEAKQAHGRDDPHPKGA